MILMVCNLRHSVNRFYLATALILILLYTSGLYLHRFFHPVNVNLMNKFVATVLSFASLPLLAEASVPMMGEPEKGVIMEQKAYHFMVRPYAEAIHIPSDVNQRALPLNSAENAAIVHFNAMIKGDYGLWLSLWDDKTRREMIKQHYAAGQDASFWRKWWRKGFLGYKKFELVRKVESGEFVIIEMKASASGMKDMYLDVPLRKVAPNQWRTTEALKKDPVFMHWRKRTHTVQTTAR